MDAQKLIHITLKEINQMANEAFEDGILIGADPNQIRSVLQAAIEILKPSFSR